MNPTVVVNFLTYTPSMEHPRVQYARQCLASLLKNLKYSQGELVWHIADDGSPEEHVMYLEAMVLAQGSVPTSSKSEHMGYGGNWNVATQVTHSVGKYVLAVEEDWELVKRFDVSALVRALEEEERINCIRLGYLGWTNELRGSLIQADGQTFLLFDPESTETHVFAGHPRLERVSFEQSIGEWPVGIKAGWTEMEICKRPESRIGVAWPLDADINASQDFCSMFAHVGDEQA